MTEQVNYSSWNIPADVWDPKHWPEQKDKVSVYQSQEGGKNYAAPAELGLDGYGRRWPCSSVVSVLA